MGRRVWDRASRRSRAGQPALHDWTGTAGRCPLLQRRRGLRLRCGRFELRTTLSMMADDFGPSGEEEKWGNRRSQPWGGKRDEHSEGASVEVPW